MKSYDVAIIGAGSAGLMAAETAHLFRKKTALIAGPQFGGDCLWYGCVPSKALLHASSHGLNWEGVKQQIHDAQRTIMTNHQNPEYYRSRGIDVYEDCAQFIDSHHLQVGEHKIYAKYILIATGSSPAIPPIPGLAETPHYTNEDVYHLKTLPKTLVVLGGGPIGCEMAQAMAYLGVQVHLIQRNVRLLPKEDPLASEIINKHFVKQGIHVYTASTTTHVKKLEHGHVEVGISHNGHTKTLTAEAILVAIGRTPNVDGIGLDNISLRLTPRGIEHNRHLQTNIRHIYVAGDVAGDYLFTHWAGIQASAAIRNMFMPIKKAFAPKVLSWVTFTKPEIAHAGYSEEEIIKKNMKYKTVLIDYKEIDRAVAECHTEGFIKMFIGQNGRIIGSQIVGLRAGEIIHELVLAMECDIPATRLAGIIHAYPTYGSGIQQALFASLEQTAATRIRVGRLLSKLT